MNVREVLARLTGVKRAGPNKWTAFCPCCETGKTKGNRHLGVFEDRKGKPRFKCLHDCRSEDIVKAVESRGRNGLAPGHRKRGNKKSGGKKMGKTYASVEAAVEWLREDLNGVMAGRWDYTDAFTVLREKQNRAQLRGERERFASVLVPVVMVASAAWVAFLALANVRERRAEIGILGALGLRSRQILVLFLSKAVAMGFAGGAVGLLAGFLVGKHLGITLEHVGPGEALFDPRLAVPALVLAPLLTVVARWIPAIIAARQDPADILREE